MVIPTGVRVQGENDALLLFVHVWRIYLTGYAEPYDSDCHHRSEGSERLGQGCVSEELCFRQLARRIMFADAPDMCRVQRKGMWIG